MDFGRHLRRCVIGVSRPCLSLSRGHGEAPLLMGRQSDGEENRTEDRRLRCQLGFLSQTRTMIRTIRKRADEPGDRDQREHATSKLPSDTHISPAWLRPGGRRLAPIPTDTHRNPSFGHSGCSRSSRPLHGHGGGGRGGGVVIHTPQILPPRFLSRRF